MENIIQELIKIEKAAEKIFQEAEAHQKTLPQRIEGEKRKITRQLQRDTTEQIQQLRLQSQKQTAEQQQAYETTSREAICRLEQEFAEHAQNWEDQIFRRICYGLQESERKDQGHEQPPSGGEGL